MKEKIASHLNSTSSKQEVGIIMETRRYNEKNVNETWTMEKFRYKKFSEKRGKGMSYWKCLNIHLIILFFFQILIGNCKKAKLYSSLLNVYLVCRIYVVNDMLPLYRYSRAHWYVKCFVQKYIQDISTLLESAMREGEARARYALIRLLQFCLNDLNFLV